jgi:pyruvate/2-oxoacid:ferredoxin oxidoreductase beta subunit
MAVKTNFFPLWESENGEIRFTRETKKPKPIGEYTKLIKKFAHLDEKGVERLQKDVDFNYSLLSRLSGKCEQGGLDD